MTQFSFPEWFSSLPLLIYGKGTDQTDQDKREITDQTSQRSAGGSRQTRTVPTGQCPQWSMSELTHSTAFFNIVSTFIYQHC